MGKEFNSKNVRKVAQAISSYLGEEKRIVVGYDTRRNSLKFAREVCGVLEANEIESFLTARETPTPVLAFSVSNYSFDGGVMITASHNSPNYNGIKFIPQYAGPATEDITKAIEEKIGPQVKYEKVEPSLIDPMKDYLEHVKGLIDFDAIRRGNLKVVLDPMHGTGGEYLFRLFEIGCEVRMLNLEKDENFGGRNPDPTEENLGELKKAVKGDAQFGVATDGDADRVALIDGCGVYLNPNQIFAILLDYLALRGGAVVKTLATTDLVNEIAKRHNLELFEVPVGFKYVSEIMRNHQVLIGGEESGGFSFKGHIPEKDGILTSCFLLEASAKGEKTPYELYSEVERKYGKRFSKRIGVPLEDSKRFSNLKIPGFVSGLKVLKLDRRDGIKICLKDSWLLLRPSGTENLLRIYGEAKDEDTLNKLLSWGLNFAEKVIS